MTLVVIAVYALWMAIETDHNNAEVEEDTLLVFVVADQIFCGFFFLELAVRFGAFAKKLTCFSDSWFVFDFALVSLMVLETWLMKLVLVVGVGGGKGTNFLRNGALLRLARLLRLSRLFRMVRLLRMVPELVIIIKAIGSAMRSVMFILALLLVAVYVFGIAFTQLLKKTDVGDAYFPDVIESMHSLLMHGALLDSIATLMVLIKAENMMACILLYIFVTFSALTIMNMLIGMLCEVIATVAAVEKEAVLILTVKETLLMLFDKKFDKNHDQMLQKSEFHQMMEDRGAQKALLSLGVDPESLEQLVDIIFDDEELENPSITISKFMETASELRGANSATVKDLAILRKWSTDQFKAMTTVIKSEIATLRPLLDSSAASVKAPTVQPTSLKEASHGIAPPVSPAMCVNDLKPGVVTNLQDLSAFHSLKVKEMTHEMTADTEPEAWTIDATETRSNEVDKPLPGWALHGIELRRNALRREASLAPASEPDSPRVEQRLAVCGCFSRAAVCDGRPAFSQIEQPLGQPAEPTVPDSRTCC